MANSKFVIKEHSKRIVFQYPSWLDLYLYNSCIQIIFFSVSESLLLQNIPQDKAISSNVHLQLRDPISGRGNASIFTVLCPLLSRSQVILEELYHFLTPVIQSDM